MTASAPASTASVAQDLVALCRRGQNLDAITGKEHWEMYGTTGDAKGQPVQINHPSHGSPWCRIRRIMVGAAYS